LSQIDSSRDLSRYKTEDGIWKKWIFERLPEERREMFYEIKIELA
jgi:hypothetical protein